METIVRTIYKFSELAGAARESARMWFIGDISADHIAGDEIVEFVRIAGMLGIRIDEQKVSTVAGRPRYEPCVFWSGFYTQSSGACFKGWYSYARGGAKAVRAQLPYDTELHRIADALQAAQKAQLYQLTGQIRLTDRYSHSSSIDIDLEHKQDRWRDVTGSRHEIRQALRDLADWLFKRLQGEWDDLPSDDAVADAMEDRDYRFYKDGSPVTQADLAQAA